MEIDHTSVLAGQLVSIGFPLKIWRGQCVHNRHGSTDAWEVKARSQYEAGVKLRIELRAQGRVMPADLVWTEIGD